METNAHSQRASEQLCFTFGTYTWHTDENKGNDDALEESFLHSPNRFYE